MQTRERRQRRHAMKVRRSRNGSVEVIGPQGPIQRGDLDELQAALRTGLADRGGRLVLDVSRVPYMDSAALELLLELATDRRGAGGALKLAAITPTCREILDLTGLLGEFEVFETPEDAVRSFL